MKGGCGTSIGTGMTYRCHRWNIVDQAVVITIPLIYHPSEPITRVPIKIYREIVPAHLVYHDTYHQFGFLTKLRTVICGRGR